MGNPYRNSHDAGPGRRNRRAQLFSFRSILATGDLHSVLEQAGSFEKAGDRPLAETLRLMAAAQRRDHDRIDQILNSPAADAIRADVVLDYALILSLYWAAGASAACPEIKRRTAQGCDGLPADWAQDLSHLAAIIESLDEKPPQVDCDGTSEIRFVEGQSLLVIKASVNDHPPEFFIVDTGAPTTVLSAEYATEVGLEFDKTNYKESRDGAGNKINLYPALLEKLTLGNAAAFMYPVHVMDFSKRLAVKGIISPLETFRDLLIEIDLRRHVLKMCRPQSIDLTDYLRTTDWSQELLWNEGSPSIAVKINSSYDSFFLLDTGAGANILCTTLLERLGLNLNSQSQLQSATAAGQTNIYQGFKGQLAVGPSAEADTDFLAKECFAEPNTLFPRMVDGYIGVPWFRGRRVVFAPGGRTVHFTNVA